MVRRGPKRGGVGRNPHIRSSIIVAAIAIAAALVYLVFQISMPTQSGPDAGYYLLGCEQLDAGLWPWGSEPPLAFVVLYPWVRLLPPVVGLTACSALLGGITVWLMAHLCGKHGGSAAAVVGALLSIGFMAPLFVTGLLKNEVVNVLLIAVLIAITAGRYWLAGGGILLAATAHPGITLTFVAALFAAVALSHVSSSGAQMKTRWSRLLASPGSGGRVRWWGVLILGGGACMAGAWIAAPTVMRYLSTYLGQDVGGVSAGAFQWDVGQAFFRYLFLWPFAAMAIGRLRRDAASATAQRPAQTAKATAFVWIVVLLGLAAVTGLASRRFEVQLFIPLIALAAPEMASQFSRVAESSPVRTAARRSSVVLTIVFGLAMIASGVLGRAPLLDAAQVADLQALAGVLPEDARIVVALSDARYWVEYFTDRPVLGPFLARERLASEGPLFLFTQDPTNQGLRWPSETLAELSDREAVVWNANGIMLLRAEWDQAFFDDWRDPREAEAVATLVGVAAPPGSGFAVTSASAVGLVVGWLLFWPLGIAFSVVHFPALATAIGLPVTVAFWWAAVDLVGARRRADRTGRQGIGQSA